ncbi:glycosyltransferase [Crossiella sp. CA198]|uniref:glycosyltransferase n=1 Tax=Crossiella sp. CA198 TaxID=3455607 RepID=UPI003F8D3DAD
MRVVIMTVGTRGDVAPFLGLGVRLHAAGHEVTVATQQSSAELVTGAGLAFRPLPGDMKADMASADGQRWTKAGATLRAIPAQLRLGKRFMIGMGQAVLAAAAGAEVLLLARAPMMHGYLAGQALGIPTVGLELWPSVPTGDFPLPLFGDRNFGRWGNRNLHQPVLFAPTPFDADFKGFCREIGLPPVGIGRIRRTMLADERWPILHGYSPLVVPRPADWRPGAEVAGYWWQPTPPEWRPAPELADFLAAGAPPVFIGLGSMASGEGERLSGIVAEAARQAGVRAVVQAGWAGLSAAGDDVLTVGDIPHDWLFPRMAALVQHAGAGTTGAVLRAGVPTVPVPVAFDQPFWAGRLARLGISPGALPFKRLAAPALAERIRQAVGEPAFADRARVLGERVRAEDGAAPVLRVLEELAGG